MKENDVFRSLGTKLLVALLHKSLCVCTLFIMMIFIQRRVCSICTSVTFSIIQNWEHTWLNLKSTEEVDEVSVTVILVGLAHNGLEEKAIRFFINMLQAGAETDANELL